jgi:hypothetical protein
VCGGGGGGWVGGGQGAAGRQRAGRGGCPASSAGSCSQEQGRLRAAAPAAHSGPRSRWGRSSSWCCSSRRRPRGTGWAPGQARWQRRLQRRRQPASQPARQGALPQAARLQQGCAGAQCAGCGRENRALSVPHQWLPYLALGHHPRARLPLEAARRRPAAAPAPPRRRRRRAAPTARSPSVDWLSTGAA